MITVKNLISLERILLEIENRFKFQLKFAEVIELNEFLNKVGEITTLCFALQSEHYEKFGDSEALGAYHNQLMGDKVKLNTTKMIEFIKDVCNRFVDDEFGEIVVKNQFWD